MSNYTKATDFAIKDSLLTGNPLKLITGTAHDNEYNAIAVAVATKVDSNGALGTPSSGTLTNCTGLPVSTGVSGFGTGVATALAVNVGSAGAPVVNGGALGTPSSGTLTSCTGLPVSTGISGLAANVATFLATPSSANLAAALTDETGTGAAVFATSPSLTTPSVTAPTSASHALRADTAKISQLSAEFTVATNALTVSVNPCIVDFRNSTLTTGAPNTRFLTSAATVIVPDTATLGTTNGVASRLIAGLIDNSGTLEAFIINQAGGVNLDESGVISTTAITTGADSANVAYSTTARTNVPYKIVGACDITEATAGTWATSPTTVYTSNGIPNYVTGSLTIAAQTGAITSYTATYQLTKIERLVTLIFDITITNAGTGSGGITVTIPHTSTSLICGSAREIVSTGFQCSCSSASAGSLFSIFRYDNATIIGTNNRIVGRVDYFI